MLNAPPFLPSCSGLPDKAVDALPLGAFVWTNFPFGDPPAARSQPASSPHIAYHLGSYANGLVLLAYTSSGSWRGPAVIKPLGVVEFDDAEARKMNQKAFHLDLRTLAKVRLTDAWFPYLANANRGIVGIADVGVQAIILKAATTLSTRPETVEYRGIGSTTMTSIRRPNP